MHRCRLSGYRLDALIARLRTLRADIICLQEVDVCRDEDRLAVDTFVSIARALSMNGVFAAHHAYSWGQSGRGAWGCCILSRFPINERSVEQVMLYHTENYPRSALIADVRLPPRQGRPQSQSQSQEAPRTLRVVSAHLEVCCGLSHRVRQFQQVLQRLEARHAADAKSGAAAASASSTLGSRVPVVLCGDLNTVAHKISRISPVHCVDSYRWRSWGKSEPQWWVDNVLPRTGLRDPFDKEQSTLLRPWCVHVWALPARCALVLSRSNCIVCVVVAVD